MCDEDRWLSIAEVCEWMGTNEAHVRKMIQRGHIPYRKVGQLIRFSRRELEEWSKPAPKPQSQPAPRQARQRPVTRAELRQRFKGTPEERLARVKTELDAIEKRHYG